MVRFVPVPLYIWGVCSQKKQCFHIPLRIWTSNTQYKKVCLDGELKLLNLTIITRISWAYIKFESPRHGSGSMRSLTLNPMLTLNECICHVSVRNVPVVKVVLCTAYILLKNGGLILDYIGAITQNLLQLKRLTTPFNLACHPCLTNWKQKHVSKLPMNTDQRSLCVSHNRSDKAKKIWKYM